MTGNAGLVLCIGLIVIIAIAYFYFKLWKIERSTNESTNKAIEKTEIAQKKVDIAQKDSDNKVNAYLNMANDLAKKKKEYDDARASTNSNDTK